MGQSGLVLHTSDGGTNWELEGSGTDRDLHIVRPTGKNYLIAAGAGGTIVKRTIDKDNAR